MTDEFTGADDPAPAEPLDSGVPGTEHASEVQWAEKDPQPGLDVGQAEVQARTDAFEEKGFIGTQIDPTPNEHYSLQTPPDAPTPETDPELAAKAKASIDADRSVGKVGAPTPPIPEEG